MYFTHGATFLRTSVITEVGGVEYAVGTSSEATLPISYFPCLDEHFYDSSEYIALLRAALHLTGQQTIDHLIVGLPLSTVKFGKCSEFKQRLIGQHETSMNGIARRTNICNALLAPQTAGTPLSRCNTAMLEGNRVLTIDTGYRNVTWLATEDLRLIPARSGSYPVGMYSLIVGLAGQIEYMHNGSVVVDPSIIDEVLRKGRTLEIDKNIIQADQLSRLLLALSKNAANAVAASIETDADFPTIVMTGGAVHYFLPAFKEKFPDRQIHTVYNPIYANVRGLYKHTAATLRSHSESFDTLPTDHSAHSESDPECQ